jgi:hypothetical protein
MRACIRGSQQSSSTFTRQSSKPKRTDSSATQGYKVEANDDDDDDDESSDGSVANTAEDALQLQESVLVLYNQMKIRGITPDTSSLSSYLTACRSASLWKTSLKTLLNEMHYPAVIKRGDVSFDGFRGPQYEETRILPAQMNPSAGDLLPIPTSIHYKITLETLREAGQWRECAALMKTLVSRNAPGECFTHSSKIICFSDASRSLYHHSRSLFLYPPFPPSGLDTACFNAAIRCVGQYGALDLSERIYADMAKVCSPASNELAVGIGLQ